MEATMQTANKVTLIESDAKPIPYRLFVSLSLGFWAAATLILRLWGQVFIVPTSNFLMAVDFLELLFLPPLILSIFRWQNVPPHQRSIAAICLAVPSMLLDVPMSFFFSHLFPNLPASTSSAFGAWLLWGYALMLLTGAIASRADRSQVA